MEKISPAQRESSREMRKLSSKINGPGSLEGGGEMIN